MKLESAVNEFLLESELRRLTPKTIRGYKATCRKFVYWLEAECEIEAIEDVRTPHLKKYMQLLISQGCKATYGNTVIKTLRSFFKYLYEEELVEVNPTLKLKWQKEARVIIDAFNDAEVARMMQVYAKGKTYMEVRNHLILAIAFDTGCRNSEICGIEVGDIKGNVIQIHGKGQKDRHVCITPTIKKIMGRYDRARELYFSDKNLKDDHYLLSRTGRVLTPEGLEHIFKQCGKVAKVRPEIRCSPHTARHYFAQANLINGLDVYSLSRLLGHDNINITKRYLQSIQDKNIVAMATATSPLSNLK